jgi:hypothetical protein
MRLRSQIIAVERQQIESSGEHVGIDAPRDQPIEVRHVGLLAATMAEPTLRAAAVPLIRRFGVGCTKVP